jgi:hypothetical protein
VLPLFCALFPVLTLLSAFAFLLLSTFFAASAAVLLSQKLPLSVYMHGKSSAIVIKYLRAGLPIVTHLKFAKKGKNPKTPDRYLDLATTLMPQSINGFDHVTALLLYLFIRAKFLPAVNVEEPGNNLKPFAPEMLFVNRDYDVQGMWTESRKKLLKDKDMPQLAALVLKNITGYFGRYCFVLSCLHSVSQSTPLLSQ